jgi:hypothetical protein
LAECRRRGGRVGGGTHLIAPTGAAGVWLMSASKPPGLGFVHAVWNGVRNGGRG